MFLVTFAWWSLTLILLGTLIVGAVIGFLVSRKIFSNYLEKNPPINEKMIRTLFQQMGRTPSEKQVRQIMQSMQQAK
ncbi:MAG: YneF family protein [Bacilli bacterium]|nr:YneF family protein [Bacilli bacterium]MDD4388355.1 YneF family protein [Bacilli bacterium]